MPSPPAGDGDADAPRLQRDAVVGLFEAGGAVATALAEFEQRPQQLAMLEAVARAFNDDEILSVEAGTGTGKSLAYLVPAILWSRASGRRVVVSTHTITLQEQLVRKDLPFLADRVGLHCRTALIKGRGNYLCQRKAAQAAAQPTELIEDDRVAELRALLAWAAETREGSLSDLPTRPRPEVWELLACEQDNCLRSGCGFHATCFFYAARRAAAAADVLVVNHHLLMADLAIRSAAENWEEDAVLPPSARVIIDEAHHLEDVATAYFGTQVSLIAVDRVCSRLQSRRTAGKGVLPAIATALHLVRGGADLPAADGAIRWIDQRLIPGSAAVVTDAEECFTRLLDAYVARCERDDAGLDEKLRITPEVRGTPFWHTATARITALATALDAYASDLDGVLQRLARLSDAVDDQVRYLGTELAALRGRLSGLAAALLAFLDDQPDHCAWLEVRRRHGQPSLSLHRAPIAVAPLLQSALFQPFATTVLTSATLAVGGDFSFLHERLGLDRVDPPERVRTLRVDSPFVFSRQALLLAPTDLPEPTDHRFEPASHRAMCRILDITRGGTFLLFTAYGALNRAWFELAGALRAAGFTPLRQGEIARHVLLSRFTREARAVLFATDSFWEGVDVRGDALRCVVITRLPFRVPTEPIEQARVEAIAARGGDPFLERALPQAVIKLKQGFGRLIRSRSDRGSVVVLDSRLTRKRYGRVFLESLPPARQVIAPLDRALAEMAAFHAT